jgi:hypothetical protein
MRFAFALAVLALLASAHEEAPALGINCRGSSKCKGNAVVKSLYNDINKIPDNNHFDNGKHIACEGHICAFLQHTTSGCYAKQLKSLAYALYAHSCQVCGSVPIDFPESNDPKNGILTFNYVSDTGNGCDDGPC